MYVKSVRRLNQDFIYLVWRDTKTGNPESNFGFENGFFKPTTYTCKYTHIIAAKIDMGRNEI